MTQLIREQLSAIGLMACGGMAAGLIYECISVIADILRKTDSPDISERAGCGVFSPGWLRRQDCC